MCEEKVAPLFHVLPLDLPDKVRLVVCTSASVLPVMFKFDFLQKYSYECDEN